MGRHVVPFPWSGVDPVDLVWDDEAGTVEAAEADDEHALWVAREIGELLARPTPLNLSRDGMIRILQDPAHDPRDFWHMLPFECWAGKPLYSRMPEILRNVEPTPIRAAPLPRIIDEHGVERDAIPGAEFCW